MRKIVSSACLALVLVASACGGDDDDDASTDSSNSSDDSGGDTREEYVDAIAVSVTSDEGDEESPFGDLSDEDAQCVGAAYVDTIGVDELAAKATPAEIEAQPSADHTDWGIELTDDQGLEVYRGIVDCAPESQQAIADGVAQGFTEGFTGEAGDVDIDEECLADKDPADIEGFIGGAIAQGDAYVPDAEQGTALLDWFGDCIDLRGAFVAVIGSDPSVPDGVPECLSEGVDDRFIHDFWELAFTSGGDQAALQDSPLTAELQSVMSGCAQSLTTTTAPA